MRQTIYSRNAEGLVEHLRETADFLQSLMTKGLPGRDRRECIRHRARLEVWVEYFEMKEPFDYDVKISDHSTDRK